jgi:hypothetical protein
MLLCIKNSMGDDEQSKERKKLRASMLYLSLLQHNNNIHEGTSLFLQGA